MTHEQLQGLKAGDIIPSPSGFGYIVTDNFGERVTAVKTADLTNPAEWHLVGHAAKQSQVNAYVVRFISGNDLGLVAICPSEEGAEQLMSEMASRCPSNEYWYEEHTIDECMEFLLSNDEDRHKPEEYTE